MTMRGGIIRGKDHVRGTMGGKWKMRGELEKRGGKAKLKWELKEKLNI